MTVKPVPGGYRDNGLLRAALVDTQTVSEVTDKLMDVAKDRYQTIYPLALEMQVILHRVENNLLRMQLIRQTARDPDGMPVP